MGIRPSFIVNDSTAPTVLLSRDNSGHLSATAAKIHLSYLNRVWAKTHGVGPLLYPRGTVPNVRVANDDPFGMGLKWFTLCDELGHPHILKCLPVHAIYTRRLRQSLQCRGVRVRRWPGPP